jgi:hypothetical protein
MPQRFTNSRLAAFFIELNLRKSARHAIIYNVPALALAA